MTKQEREDYHKKFTVYTTGKDDLDEDANIIGKELSVNKALNLFNLAMIHHQNDNCYLTYNGKDVVVYDPDVKDITNMSDVFKGMKPQYENYFWTIDTKYLRNEVNDYCDKFNRANNAPTITKYFAEDEEHSDFDGYDIDFDCLGTCVEPDEYDMNDPYDKFTRYIYDNVKVVRQIDDSTAVCDWSGFVYENFNALREFADKYWVKGNYDDDDDFTAEWIEQINLMLAGYGANEDYEMFLEVVGQHTETCAKHRKHIEDELLPYTLPANLEKNYGILNGKPREIKGLYPEEVLVPMPGADKLSELKAEYDPAVKKAAEDYDAGRDFPDNGNFEGLKNFRIIAELNDTVLAVRSTDHTYATWSGDSEHGVEGGHYMMTRQQALEDFAVRAQMIDTDKYQTKDKELETCKQEVKDYYESRGKVTTEETINDIAESYLHALNNDFSARHEILESVIDSRKPTTVQQQTKGKHQ